MVGEKTNFNNKTLLISGGTGSFGNAVLSKFIESDLKEIRIFSRDEKKQDEMRRNLNNPKLKFVIGDVRDPNSVHAVTRGVDYIFHAAALKQVPSCEFYPYQAVQTNIIGAENMLRSADENGVSRVVVLSTDKAVYPINAMGMSKALMEKLMVAKSRVAESTVYCGTRYGNVMASRGSVIPLFIRQIKEGQDITITNPEMTRFMMSLESSVDLVHYAFSHANTGDIFVQKAPACTIAVLAEALKQIFKSDTKTRIIGTRHGEKLYETLLTREEMAKAEDMGRYYRIPADSRDLNYDRFFSEGEVDFDNELDYNSHNTERLDVQGTIDLLMKLPYVQSELANS